MFNALWLVPITLAIIVVLGSMMRPVDWREENKKDRRRNDNDE